MGISDGKRHYCDGCRILSCNYSAKSIGKSKRSEGKRAERKCHVKHNALFLIEAPRHLVIAITALSGPPELWPTLIKKMPLCVRVLASFQRLY